MIDDIVTILLLPLENKILKVCGIRFHLRKKRFLVNNFLLRWWLLLICINLANWLLLLLFLSLTLLYCWRWVLIIAFFWDPKLTFLRARLSFNELLLLVVNDTGQVQIFLHVNILRLRDGGAELRECRIAFAWFWSLVIFWVLLIYSNLFCII